MNVHPDLWLWDDILNNGLDVSEKMRDDDGWLLCLPKPRPRILNGQFRNSTRTEGASVVEKLASTSSSPAVARFVVCGCFPPTLIRLDATNGAKALGNVLEKPVNMLHIHQEIVDDLVGWTLDALKLGNDDARWDDTLDTLHKTDECLCRVDLVLIADVGGDEKEHLGREVRGNWDQFLIAESACKIIPAWIIPACEIALIVSTFCLGALHKRALDFANLRSE